MFYLTVVIISIILITSSNLLLTPLPPGGFEMTTLSVLTAAAAIFALDALLALIVRRLTPAKWYAPESKIFAVSKHEREFYVRLKIKHWKDKVPEWGGLTAFHKNKLESCSDTAYLHRFITEANFGVVVHASNAILGSLIAFIPLCSSPTVWVPVFAINCILSLMPIAVLRYTSYTLLRLYNRSLSRIK